MVPSVATSPGLNSIMRTIVAEAAPVSSRRSGLPVHSPPTASARRPLESHELTTVSIAPIQHKAMRIFFINISLRLN